MPRFEGAKAIECRGTKKIRKACVYKRDLKHIDVTVILGAAIFVSLVPISLHFCTCAGRVIFLDWQYHTGILDDGGYLASIVKAHGHRGSILLHGPEATRTSNPAGYFEFTHAHDAVVAS